MDDLRQTGVEALIPRLCLASCRQRGMEEIEWPAAIDSTAWGMSPELVSISGTPVFDALSTAEQKRLSHLEIVNFFSLNIHGEKRLIAGIAERLYGTEDPIVTSYLLHFIEEEARHLSYFGGYCRRYGEIFPERAIASPLAQEDHEAGALSFFARILIFEAVVDAYNRVMAIDERVDGLVREINRRHHVDESRHLAFGRTLVADLAADFVRSHSTRDVQSMSCGLERYFSSIWRDLANLTIYTCAGLNDPYGLHKAALGLLVGRDSQVRGELQVLTEVGFLLEKTP